MLIRRDRKMYLTERILGYLDCLGESCHYLILADVLRRPAETVESACWHLAKKGRLQRTGEGVYAITARGRRALQGASS